MSRPHKYDELYRLLVAQQAAIAATIRHANSLGIRRTVAKLEAIESSSRTISNAVLTKIEASEIADELDAVADRNSPPVF